MADSSDPDIQNLTLQGVKEGNGMEYMNGNGINSPENMEDLDTDFHGAHMAKVPSNSEYVLDPNAAPFQPMRDQNLQQTDQSVPMSVGDVTQPSPMTSDDSVQPASQDQSNDGVLIDFGVKDNVSPSPASLPGANDTAQMSAQGQFSPMDFQQKDIMSDECGIDNASLSHGIDSTTGFVSDSPAQQDFSQLELECECDSSMIDSSLSQNVMDEDVQEHAVNRSLSYENGDSHDVIQSDVAQVDGNVPMSLENQPEDSRTCQTDTSVEENAYQSKSFRDRNSSYDDQIVPGVCSCTDEPEPEVHEDSTNQQPTPQIRLQTEDDGFIDREENVDDQEEYYDESDEDTASDDMGEEHVDVRSDPGDHGEGDDDLYSDEGEYTDDEDYEGGDSYRASEEREIVSDYDDEQRSSEERQVSEDASQTVSQEGVVDSVPQTGADLQSERITALDRQGDETVDNGASDVQRGLKEEGVVVPTDEKEYIDSVCDQTNESETKVLTEKPDLIASHEVDDSVMRDIDVDDNVRVSEERENIPGSMIDDALSSGQKREEHPNGEFSTVMTTGLEREPPSGEGDVVGDQMMAHDREFPTGQMDDVRERPVCEPDEQIDVPSDETSSEIVSQEERVVPGGEADEKLRSEQDENLGMYDDRISSEEMEKVNYDVIDREKKMLLSAETGIESDGVKGDDKTEILNEKEFFDDRGDKVLDYEMQVCGTGAEIDMTDIASGIEKNVKEIDDSVNMQEPKMSVGNEEFGDFSEKVIERNTNVEDAEMKEKSDVGDKNQEEMICKLNVDEESELHSKEDLQKCENEIESEQVLRESEDKKIDIVESSETPIFDQNNQLKEEFDSKIGERGFHGFEMGDDTKIEHEQDGVMEEITDTKGDEIIKSVDNEMDNKMELEENMKNDNNSETESVPTNLNFDKETQKLSDDNTEQDADVSGHHGDDQKGDTFIESEGSDMEERAITPDPIHLSHTESPEHSPEPAAQQTVDVQQDETTEKFHTINDRESDPMTGSIVMDEGQSLEEMPICSRESDAMTGSVVLDEGQTFEEMVHDNKESDPMTGSFVMDEGGTIEDMPNRESDPMTGSIVLDEGQTFEEVPNRESDPMTGSIVLDEGQTFEEVPNRESDPMTGSIVLDESQTFEEVPNRESDPMTGSIVLDEGQTFEEVPNRESDPMTGSIVLDEGQTFEEVPNKETEPVTGFIEVDEGQTLEEVQNEMSKSVMEGSLILDEGQNIDDVHQVQQAQYEDSPEDEVGPQQTVGSMMEGSLVMAEGQTIDDLPLEQNVMSRSLMEDSIVLEEGETFEDKKFEADPTQLQMEDSSKSEDSPISPNADMNKMTGSMMEGSIVLDKDEKLEDRFPSNQMSSSFVEDSGTLDEGQSYETSNVMSESYTESYSENIEQEEKSLTYMDEETMMQRQTAQNMVENVLNDAIDKVESMQKKDSEKETEDVEKNVTEVASERIIEKSDEAQKEEKISKEIKKSAKSEKDKKNVSALKEEKKKAMKEKSEKVKIKSKTVAKEKPATVKEKPAKTKETEKPRDNKYSHITSRLTQDTSASLARKTVKKTEQKPDTKIPSPSKSEVSRRSQSATRQSRSRKPDSQTEEDKKEAIQRSKSTPRPQTAHRRYTTSPYRGEITTTRNARPTKLQPTKDTSSETKSEEEKEGKRTPSASSKKKYGIDAKNTSYKPGGGNVKIFDQKVSVKASPRIDAKTPTASSPSPRKESPHPKPTTPKGPSPNVKNVTSRIGSLHNAKHTPGGGQVKITSKKTDYSTVGSKVGSTKNMEHKPGGGDKKILSQKLEWKTDSKIGSLDNAKHAPGGGNVKIESHKVEFKAQSKVGSTDFMNHKPGGGNKKIESQKLGFREKAKPKVEAKSDHKPAGGDKKIETQKLNFKETAKPRTDSGVGASKTRTESENSQDSQK